MPAMKDEKSSAGRASRKTAASLSEEERAAIAEHVKELRTARRGGGADGESDVLAKIAEMPEADRMMAERLHAIVKASAPELTARTWYGMPAYARGASVVCFFQSSHKFKTRYATLGFSDKAQLDDGEMWPTSFALTSMTAATEKRIAALVKSAIS